MRPSAAAVAAFLVVATAASAQNPTPAPAARPAPPPIRLAASSFATVEVHVNAIQAGGDWYAEDAGLSGPARIAIRYGQPHARGRTIEGGLVPRDTVWRFGANEATTLHSDVDLTLGGTRLGRGDYSLFMLNGRDGWKLVVNRQTGQWGTDRDSTMDLARIPMAARTTQDAEESLSIYLVPSSARPASGYATLDGVLRVRWGKTELTAPWTVLTGQPARP